MGGLLNACAGDFDDTILCLLTYYLRSVLDKAMQILGRFEAIMNYHKPYRIFPTANRFDELAYR